MSKKPEFVLGTVQLGMPYGAANQSGMPSEAEAILMVRHVQQAGTCSIDTARAYGVAEDRIGIALAGARRPLVVTKLDPLKEFGPYSDRTAVERGVRASLEASRRALRREFLDVVLLHRAAQMRVWDGLVWRILQDQKAMGAIGAIGVSITTVEEAWRALEDQATNHIQLPFNIVDRRWSRAGFINALRRRPEVTVHVRSVFLQGLLGGDPRTRWPNIKGFAPAECLAKLQVWADKFGRAGTLDLCLAYVRGQDWIDGIVIGADTERQLRENLDLFALTPLDPGAIEWIDNQPDPAPQALVDIPSWPAARGQATRKVRA